MVRRADGAVAHPMVGPAADGPFGPSRGAARLGVGILPSLLQNGVIRQGGYCEKKP